MNYWSHQVNQTIGATHNPVASDTYIYMHWAQRSAKGRIISVIHDRGEESQRWSPATMASPKENLSLSAVLIFTKLSQRSKILFFSHTSNIASTQRIRSIIASKVARRARGEGAPLSPTSTNDRANLCDRDFYRRHSGIDFSGNVRWEKITPAEVK